MICDEMHLQASDRRRETTMQQRVSHFFFGVEKFQLIAKIEHVSVVLYSKHRDSRVCSMSVRVEATDPP